MRPKKGRRSNFKNWNFKNWVFKNPFNQITLFFFFFFDGFTGFAWMYLYKSLFIIWIVMLFDLIVNFLCLTCRLWKSGKLLKRLWTLRLYFRSSLRYERLFSWTICHNGVVGLAWQRLRYRCLCQSFSFAWSTCWIWVTSGQMIM